MNTSASRQLINTAISHYENRVRELERENERLKSQIHDVWLNKVKAAKYLGISQTTLWRREQQGELVFIDGAIKRSTLDVHKAKRDERFRQN